MLSVRKRLLTLTLIITTFISVSCASQPSSPQSNTPASSEGQVSPQPVKIVVSSGGFGNNMTIGVEEYRKKFPDRPVELTVIPHEQLREKVLTELATHSGSMDAVPVEVPVWLQEMYTFLEPLQPYIDKSPDLNFDELLPSGIPASRYPYPNGDIYTIPVRQGVDILHYRKDLFDKAGVEVPATFDDIVAAGLKLKQPGFYPITLHLKQGVYGVQAWLIVLYGMGGRVLNDDLDEAVLGETAIQATQWLVDLVYKHQLVSETDLNAQVEDVVLNMQKGKAAMGLFSSANIYPLDAEVVDQGGVIAYAPPPHSNNVEGAGGVFWAFSFGINKDSKNKEATWHLIKFLASKEPQIRMAIETGNGPPRATVLENPEVLKANSAATATLMAMKYTRPKDPHPKWQAIEDILASEISAALAQKKTSEQAMEDARNQINSLLGE